MAVLNMRQTSAPVTAPPCTPTPKKASHELIHDDEYPVAAEHDRFAAKEIHAPEAVGRMADERQPRGSSAAGPRAIMFGQDAVHDVLVDVDPERLRNDALRSVDSRLESARLE